MIFSFKKIQKFFSNKKFLPLHKKKTKWPGYLKTDQLMMLQVNLTTKRTIITKGMVWAGRWLIRVRCMVVMGMELEVSTLIDFFCHRNDTDIDFLNVVFSRIFFEKIFFRPIPKKITNTVPLMVPLRKKYFPLNSPTWTKFIDPKIKHNRHRLQKNVKILATDFYHCTREDHGIF